MLLKCHLCKVLGRGSVCNGIILLNYIATSHWSQEEEEEEQKQKEEEEKIEDDREYWQRVLGDAYQEHQAAIIQEEERVGSVAWYNL